MGVGEKNSHYYINQIDTGIFNWTSFLKEIEKKVLTVERLDSYCMLAIDIEYFKLFNKWFGVEAGDKILQDIAMFLATVQTEYDGVAGYMSGDDFAVFMRHDKEAIQLVYEGIVKCLRFFDKNLGFAPIIGIYILGNEKDLSAMDMYDRACLAQIKAQNNISERIIYYDIAMFEKIEKEQGLIYQLRSSLQNGMMTYYLQPKCNMNTGKIVGAEALVRWKQLGQGYIPPADFIPIMEKTGLISKIDTYVWENVCKDLRSWLDAGGTAIPISVNLSRKDVYSINVAEVLKELTEKYQIPRELIEIEITESAYAKDFESIKRIIEELRELGFRVSMDDFGSGYSSLNMLKNVNVDLLKIDMNFLNMEEDSYLRGVQIIETILEMARVLEIPVVAEGVETDKHVEMLENIGCEYAQGFFYHEPMPVQEFYQLLQDENKIDTNGFSVKEKEYLELRELRDSQLLGDGLLDRMLGAFAFVEYDGKSLYCVKANERYYETVMIKQDDNVRAMRKQNMQKYIYPLDWEELLSGYEEVCQHPLEYKKVVYRAKYTQDSYRHIASRLHYLKDLGSSKLCLAQIMDITEQVEKEQDLEKSKQSLRELLHISESDTDFAELTAEQQQQVFHLYSKLLPMGMIGGYCEPGYPLFFASNEIIEMMGYESREEFVASIQGKVQNTICFDDRPRVTSEVGEEYCEGQEYVSTYRMVRKDGSLFWVLDRGRVVRTEDDRLAILSFCVDITGIMEKQQEMREEIRDLDHQNQELQFLSNRMPSGYHRCADTPEHEFLYVSNRFLAMFGYTRDEIKELFDDKYMNMVHPDDREKVRNATSWLDQEGGMNVEYRMRGKNGYLWVIDQSCKVEYQGEVFFQGAIMDVTELVTLRNRMQLLMKSSKDDIVLLTCRDGEVQKTEMLTSGYVRKHGLTEQEFLTYLNDVLQSGEMPSDYMSVIYRHFMDSLKQRESFQAMLPFNLNEENQCIYMHSEHIGSENGEDQFLWVFADMTELQQLETEAIYSNRKLETILGLTSTNYWEWDSKKKQMDLNVIDSNDVVSQLFGAQELGKHVIKNYPDMLYEQSWIAQEETERYIRFLTEAQDNKGVSRMEWKLRDANGNVNWQEIFCRPVKESGKKKNLVGYYRDITEQKMLDKKKLRKLVENDSLTGLYNRYALLEQTRDLLKDKQKQCAFIMIDMDKFKQANDVFGHTYGDSLLVHMADVLRELFQQDGIVSRMGGDEFFVVCPDLTGQALEDRLARLLKKLEVRKKSGKKEYIFTASIGYAMKPEDGNNFATLYEKADIAMFAAKMSKDSNIKKYKKSMKKIREELA